MTFKDRLGQHINEGDIVVTHHPFWKEIIIGKIVSFTPQKVRIEVSEGQKKPKLYLREPNTLVLIENELAMLYFLSTDK